MAAKRKPITEEFAQLLKKKPKNIRETIYRVKQILADKKRWCKNENFALTNGVGCCEDEATRCCLAGALELVDGPFKSKAEARMMKVIERDFPNRDTDSIESFNDSATHREVLDMLNTAFEAR